MSMAGTVNEYLSRHHIQGEILPHPRTCSSRDTARAAHLPEDHIAKAILVEDGKGYAMVVIPGSDWLRLQALQQEADRDFRLADEAELGKLFPDCQPGAIPPLGPAYGLETFLDDRLLTLANVYFEAGDHEHLVHLPGEAFRALMKGVRHGHFSHDD